VRSHAVGRGALPALSSAWSGQTTRKVSDTTGKLPATGVSLIRPVAVAVAGFQEEKWPSLAGRAAVLAASSQQRNHEPKAARE